MDDDSEDGSSFEDGRQDRHPLLDDFLIQYPRCWEETAERAFLVYQDLTEVHGWWFTRMCFSEPLERPFIVGQKNRHDKEEVVLPIGAEEQISTCDIQAFLTCRVDQQPVSEIILAVNDLDSTLVYYKISPGLISPDSPDNVNKKRQEFSERMNRKRRHIVRCVQRAMKILNK